VANPPAEQAPGVPPGAGRGVRERWTVLLVGSAGRVIALRRIRLGIGVAAAILAAAVLSAAALGVLNAGLRETNRGLRERLEEARSRIESLQRDRERLAAQLVLAEERMREVSPFRPGTAVPEDAGRGEAPPPERAAAPETDAAPHAAVPLGAEPQPPIRPAVGVEVASFSARFGADRTTMEIRYRLVVSGAGRRPLEGHVVVVFKGTDPDPASWVSVPPVPLPRGRPDGTHRGYRFAIAHAKEFVQQMRFPAPPGAIAEAVVYVFSADGQLLTARGYEIRP